MTTTQTESADATKTRRHLNHAPLERVLCQARWPQLSKVNTAAIQVAADQLALSIGDDYPLRENQQEMQVTITPLGVSQQAGGTVHRFISADRKWIVTLGDLFIALETSVYPGHSEFIDRFEGVVAALTASIQIPILLRMGYRYTNRLQDETDLNALGIYFKPELLGGVSQSGPSGFDLAQSVTETLFRKDETSSTFSTLMVRSALLAPGTAITPDFAATNVRSWVLDLDSADESSAGIPLDSLRERVEALALRASDHFWSMINEPFVERFQ